ncbi:hypothetical protein FB45DRAFT_840542 [Roridomyces roridus]|uniref:NAD(P)-binding protein n=1 Tax=Roridomyces roridus TaxID=1738132 RepID=A0AAD7BEX2_9AGAR|nr:hypothetical protein FB45DRAFT_840542 [Roridomyces roridus]
MKRILFIGGTGYTGGPILSYFIQRQRDDPTSLDITALIRSPLKVERLRALNLRLNVVHGSHEDADLVERLAADADVVLSLADSDYLPAAQAVLRGLKQRFETTGAKSILIHLSGVGCLADNAQGMFASSTIYTDMDFTRIEALPATQPHRKVDLAIVDADSEGYVLAYIVLPSMVYGTPVGILADAGVQNPNNRWFETFIRASFERGAAGLVGEGKNCIGNVHVTEVADLVIILYDAIRSKATIGHGREGYYFADNGDLPFEEIAKVVEIGAGPRRAFTWSEIHEVRPGQLNPLPFFGNNLRSRAEKARTLGWNPVKTNEDFLAAAKIQVEHWKA